MNKTQPTRGYVFLEKTHTHTTHEELEDIYDQWAETYEKDIADVGAQSPYTIPKVLAEHWGSRSKDARILDAAGGTGVAAENLIRMGFKNIDNLDLSEKMLEKAKERNIYRNIIKGVITSEPTPGIPDNTYDALICTSALVYGHMKSDVLQEFVRMVKPGGLICYSVRKDSWDMKEYDFPMTQTILMEKKKWELVLAKEMVYHSNYDDTKNRGYVCLFRVL